MEASSVCPVKRGSLNPASKLPGENAFPHLLVWSKELRNPNVNMKFHNFCKFSINFLKLPAVFFLWSLQTCGGEWKAGEAQRRKERGWGWVCILGLKDGPLDWPEGSHPPHLTPALPHHGQRTGCRGSSPLHTSIAQGLSLAQSASPSWQMFPLGDQWWAMGRRVFPLFKFYSVEF